MISLRMRFKRTPTKPQTFSPYRDKYKVVYSENGNKEFVKVSTENVDEIIQSFLPSTLLENIVKRAVHDPSVLQRATGSYMDLTQVPANMAEAQGVINNAKAIFESLEADEKKAYNSDFNTFLGSFRTATGLSQFVSMNKAKLKKTETKSQEVKPDAEHA